MLLKEEERCVDDRGAPVRLDLVADVVEFIAGVVALWTARRRVEECTIARRDRI